MGLLDKLNRIKFWEQKLSPQELMIQKLGMLSFFIFMGSVFAFIRFHSDKFGFILFGISVCLELYLGYQEKKIGSIVRDIPQPWGAIRGPWARKTALRWKIIKLLIMSFIILLSYLKYSKLL
jgi:hypothetical protein